MNEVAEIAHKDDFSFFSLVLDAGIVVKIVVALLLIYSVWSWAIIIEKYFSLKSVENRSNKFEKAFWSGYMLEELYEKIRHRADHPLAIIFVAAINEWNKQNLDLLAGNPYLSFGIKERIYQVMDVAKNKEISKLESNINFLSIVGYTGPFIGLFGTVWGIMDSFQSIAIAKNATLAVVAPGIAESLFATALGLIAAIPAVIFYNYLNAKLSKLDERFGDFSSELGTLLSREIDNKLD